jgi:uncharacterized protein (DUF2267 family)
MQYDEFLSRVQEMAKLDSQDDADTFTRVILGTLGERIYRSRRDNLSAQLPKELKEMLGARTEPETTRKDVDRFSLEEFHNHVCARADIAYDRAVEVTGSVMAVLREAVTASEWADLQAELPGEYDQILQDMAS